MKRIKYFVVIIIICILVFIGIELFRKVEDKEKDHTNTSINENTINSGDAKDPIKENVENIQNIQNSEAVNTTIQRPVEIKTGEELMRKAEKTLTARGWAGASNNIIGLKDNTIYYYNRETKELKKIAKGIEDIYYKTDDSEEVTAKKGKNTEILDENIAFLIYE